ncbi:hypothetical protein LMH87_009484 [Akanthomyces muscarius]|uniref:Uncharacterized protein n=1 Tax=Akanthomyces muscarius TaxID=2231603 RepID=A0A9W8QE27_AKAMU|nr:hypothetical protein LMH87_009484 [Akanthomyces muscarius]KAJ4152969.1 hypothetical protein LMH87_009484 [Akanthomyces muscarius]
MWPVIGKKQDNIESNDGSYVGFDGTETTWHIHPFSFYTISQLLDRRAQLVLALPSRLVTPSFIFPTAPQISAAIIHTHPCLWETSFSACRPSPVTLHELVARTHISVLARRAARRTPKKWPTHCLMRGLDLPSYIVCSCSPALS